MSRGRHVSVFLSTRTLPVVLNDQVYPRSTFDMIEMTKGWMRRTVFVCAGDALCHVPREPPCHF